MKKIKKNKKKNTPDFGQPTGLKACGRASASLPTGLHVVVVVITGSPKYFTLKLFSNQYVKA